MPASPSFGMGMFMRMPTMSLSVEPLLESFRTGIGYDYDAHGADVRGQRRDAASAPWYRHNLVPVVLPMLDGVVDRLEAGGTAPSTSAAGRALAVLDLAAAFPDADVHGYDISVLALERAEATRADAGRRQRPVPRRPHDPLPVRRRRRPRDDVRLHPRHDPPAGDDGGDPRARSPPTASWLLVDIKARDSFTENVAKNPMASMMYGMSVMSCMASALSEPGGAGLGTLGLPESRARQMAEAAGFTRFRRLAVDHPINAFYEIRP